ncbi:MAG: hypothetical protein U9Q03_05110 [Patescibacteria group bacterium]|nr:hypothetical protein [Patescibacteria group bacterium]
MPYIKGKGKGLLIAAVLAFLGVAVFALPALAQVDLGLQYGTEFGLTTTDIRVTIGKIINAFLGLLGIIAVLIVLYAGFLWMTAGGDAQKIQKAKRWLINGVIGLIIILSAYAIASFILRAIIGEGEVIPGGGPPGCPPGQTCTIPPGGTTGFRVQSIVPYGPGPGENGWPKNYSIVASFNADVAAATVTDSSFMVWQCNERIDGGGDPQPFDESVCSPITGTRTVEENRITFKPDSSPEDDPTDFEGEYWYMARAVGVDITDTTGRVLVCLPNPPGEEGDISSVRVQRDLCDRAMAFNDLRDVEPPEVRINSPASAPAYCAEQIPVIARATDDFLPSRVDFRIDGGTDGLVDGDFSPMSSESNTELDNPFVTSQLFIDTTVLVPGTTYTLTATAWDPVPQSSETVEREFTIAFTHCCNGELDADLGETGIDCGGECDGCAGDACTEDEDCASGFCDPATGRCADRPVIELMSPDAAGVGTLITISGQFFGDRSGTVVFLGSDTDGDGEVADDDDDVVAVACSPDAWSDTEIKVEVPVGAVTGPLEVYTDAGATDRTDDDHGALLGAFVVNSDVLPGICWLDPSTDTFGQEFVIHGAGFGATDAASYVRMGGVTIDVAIGGWSDSAITAITPATLAEGVYPVKVVVGALETNTADFTLRRSSSEEGPRIVELVPTSGSVGTYVTINGTGFGSRKGLVRFIQVADTDKVSRADDPSCDNNWNDNYIIVKVPDAFGLSDEDKEAARGIGDWVTTGDYFVEVETAAPSQTSNRVDFTVNTDPLASGMCSITPDNGPPGTRFTIVGEAFGDIWSAAPESLVHFYVDAVLTKPVSIDPLLYESWDDTSISAHVPGDYGDRATWPNSGPVHVVANNIESSNSIPFMVQDCNEEGECAEGTICCTNGACQESCEPEARNSAFGWWFSTDVLPTWPQVVRRSCGDADEGTIQSPSPYANSVDACKNVLFAVQFTVDMSDATLELDYTLPEATLVGIECGDGTSAVCPEEGGEVPLVTADTVSNDDTFWFRPNPAYNEGTGYLKENFWYRFTVVSDPKAGYGITDMEGRYLDGDFDRKPGGSYTWKFRVSGDVEACAVESLVVWPSRYVIDHEGAPPSPEDGAFMSVLTGNNCNSLVCDAADIADYDITWDEESDIIDPALTLLPSGNHCEQALEARRETPSEDPALLWAYLDPEGETVTVSNSAEVSVAFADPRVVEVFPADDCTEACTNAAIGAKFNIGMDGTTFSDNVSALRCRNESCNPPFEPFGVIRSLEYITEGVGADEEVIGFELVGDGAAGVLEPSTYYMIRIHGEEDGVLSASQVPLVGLNAEGWYEWKFRTKDDPTACEVDRTEVTPASATLFYVGQRLGLSATPYGPPDECSSGGQRLMAVNYNWMWDIAPNPVLEDGFIRTNAGGWSTDPGDVENTAPTPKQGCTSDCLLVGSQRDVPQCGNGDIDTGEDCDGGVGCSDRCLWEGTPDGTCGNGVFELGENCEASIDDVTGDLLFPPGCKDPAEDGTGCIWLGASLAGSNCGNGVLSDGEACDDGNRRDGDGCSSECLHEGTYPACPPDGGVDCVSVCGDGTVQPGEDRDCDTVGRGEVAPGCSIYTCTKVGTDISPECDPAVPGCCNGVIDTGEECDDHNIDSGDGCSSRCLHEGSSIYHATPSFCGDTFVGLGEHSQCEADITLDINIDNYQGVVAANYDPEVSADTTSTVSADCALPDCLVNPEDVGTAEVMLSCTCDTEDEPDVYCNGLAADYACADSGCCVARPRVASMVPAAGTELSCRNVPVIINFTKLMDANSVKQHLYVGYDNWDYFAGGAGAAVDCPEGVLDVPPLAEARTLYVGHEEPPGFLRRIWNRVAKFFREKIIYPVFGAPPDEADAGHDGHDNYCVVEGNLVTQTIDGGLPTAYTRAIFTPRFGFPANKWIRVQVSEEAESLDGVSVIQDRRHFATPEEPDICAIASVTVDPISDLFASREEGITRPFTAIAKSDDGTIITQVEGQYEWDWDWLDQPDSDPYISPIVVAQDAVEANIAAAWVRGTQPGDLPAEYTPIDGEAVITAKATVTRTLDGEITEPDDRPVYYGTSDIIVMLCDNPWPRWQECSGDTIDLPWDYPGTPSRECMGQGRVWYPFFDSWSNTKFYYCRDATSGGDTAPALPAIKADAGDIVRLIEPAPGIMREYLFTFDTDLGPISTVNEWSRDAIGFRIMGNPAHLGISDWYDGQSFRGAPAPLSVSGYDALQEGRTVYTNAASVTDTGDIYTSR